ncbi:hypothetical protein [Jannaschia sp. 2305UL9-9]|uniref:hypothetical protein n=1 Tax=Jannaschia sp. 2305UL9-9 TaxID=3121638 RepID=UPI0035299410
MTTDAAVASRLRGHAWFALRAGRTEHWWFRYLSQLMVRPGKANANRFGPSAKDMRAPFVPFDETGGGFSEPRVPGVIPRRDVP